MFSPYPVSTSSQTGHGFMALYISAQEGHSECIQVLVSNGALVNAQSRGGITALHVAYRKVYQSSNTIVPSVRVHAFIPCTLTLLTEVFVQLAKRNNKNCILHSNVYQPEWMCVILLVILMFKHQSIVDKLIPFLWLRVVQIACERL